MCCSSGKVQLPAIETQPEPLNGLLISTDPDSNLFLKWIRTFNSCFQITTFGAKEIVKNNAINGQQFNSTFKIKGQIYHKMGSLLLMPNDSPKTRCIKLPTDFHTIIHSQDDFIDQIFPDARKQYWNHEWLAKRAILAEKKFGRQRTESQDTILYGRRPCVIKIYRYSLRCQRSW